MIKTVLGFVKRIKEAYQLSKYNPYTIAEYFRKQGAQVGEGCFIVPTMLGTEPYLVKIGNHVAIAQGVKFETHDGGTWLFRNEIPDVQVFGPIIIEDNSLIGQDAILFPNVRIGRNSIVGGGSVVITNVPPDTIVMGVPARPFGSVKQYREKCIEKWKIQRPPGCKIDEGENWWNSRHLSDNRERLKQHLLELFKSQFGNVDR